MSDLVSVIVPVYNVEKHLSECIKSIQEQSYKNLEILLVNDGSSDSSGEICNNFEKTDSRISVFHIKNTGVANARNFGVANATGKYITFIDSDDIITKDLIEVMVNKIIHDNSDYVNGAFARYVNGEITSSLDYFSDKGDVIDIEGYLTRMSEYQAGAFWGGVCTKLHKKEIIDKYNLHYESNVLFAEDFRFNIEYLKHVNIVSLVHEPMYLYRIDTLSSLSKRRRDSYKFWDEYYEIYKRFVELYELKNVYKENSKKLYRFLFKAREEVLRNSITSDKTNPRELSKLMSYICANNDIKEADKIFAPTKRSDSGLWKWLYIFKLYLMVFRINLKNLIKK